MIQKLYSVPTPTYPSTAIPDLLISDLPIFSFHAPDQSTRPLANVQKCIYVLPLGHFSFHKEWVIRVSVWTSTHWESFLSSLLSRNTALHCYPVSVCTLIPIQKLSLCLFLFLQLVIGNLPTKGL